ncbi:DUF2945 domain-containing protein [Congregibacter litoralis]|uniref:Hypervirulence associated protein TUDOR domain-containing protein n=1 Tax=Congregibacter litoralis KT71 TaxID=314285 RepID=A4A8U8_9GAMM|nr:DUF2945 domain-containing protein [Congregibacter litoralis]EAQ97490.1 hypothetical protein KT71_04255 [Congregibacter litoralis KT71]
MKDFSTNTEVRWNWGEGHATGYIREKFTDRVVRDIDGTEVVRDADEENPAYLVEQDDGQEVLKSASELEKAET